jgi:hypothetical protein
LDFNKVCWIIDDFIQERDWETGYPLLSDAAKSLGCRVHIYKHIPFSETAENIPFNDNECIVSHGSIQFTRKLEKYYGGTAIPLAYTRNVSSYFTYAAHIGEHLLNSDFVMMPYAEFVRRGVKKGTSVFIRPNSGMKTFTGKTICWDNFDIEIATMNQINNIGPEELVCVSSPKIILSEYRYLIVDGKVITGSEYGWSTSTQKFKVKDKTHPLCDDMANTISKLDWQADSVYMCDVALCDDDTAKVVELNSFSMSGLYGCDTNKVVEAVSISALREFNGEDL